MIDPNHPFYEPFWRRVAIPAVCFVWAGIELYSGAVMWAVISGGLGAFAAYKLLVERRPTPTAVTPTETEVSPVVDEPRD